MHRNVVLGHGWIDDSAIALIEQGVFGEGRAGAMTIPPRNWLGAVLGLMMRSVSKAPSQREMRTSPVTSLKRPAQGRQMTAESIKPNGLRRGWPD